MTARLTVARPHPRHGDRAVRTRLSPEVPDGAFTRVVGPNACGESMSLGAFARPLPAPRHPTSRRTR
ncbi:hypothetical protein [Actinokineospora globicatena]|uniref:hypothetical protein n=1 Tax=Actinokineospora globicatena TaxID=103729 RepID=UPI002646DAAE